MLKKHVIYSGDKAKGALKNNLVYLGLSIETKKNILNLNLAKNKILVNKLDEKNQENNNYLIKFSIDERDVTLFQKFLEINKRLIDTKTLNSSTCLVKFLEEMAKQGFTATELEPAGNIHSNLNLQLTTLENKIAQTQFREEDIGKAFVALDYIHETNSEFTKAKNNKRKVIYIQAVAKDLKVDDCDNHAFKSKENVLISFYVQRERVKDTKDIIQNALNLSLKDKEINCYLPTEADNTLLTALLNEIIGNLKASKQFAKFEKFDDFHTANQSYDKITGERVPDSSKSMPNSPFSKRNVRFQENHETKKLQKSSSEGRINQSQAQSDKVSSLAQNGNNNDIKTLKGLSKVLKNFNGHADVDKLKTTIDTQIVKPNILTDIAKLQDETYLLIEQIKKYKEESINALYELKTWLDKQDKQNIPTIDNLHSQLNKTIKKFAEDQKESFSALKFETANDSLKSIASILEKTFKSNISNAKFNRKYIVFKERVERTLDTAFSTIHTKESKYCTPAELVIKLITNGELANTFINHSNTLTTIEDNLKDYEKRINKVGSSIVDPKNPKIMEKLNELNIIFTDWKKKVEEFSPVLQANFQSQDEFIYSLEASKILFEDKVKEIEAVNTQLRERDNLSSEPKELQLQNILSAIQGKSNRLIKEGNEVAKHKAKLLLEICEKVKGVQEKLTLSGAKDEVQGSIQEVRDFMKASEDLIKYRSKFGSSFFFKIILRQDLQSRVESKWLIDKLDYQLNQMETHLTGPAI